MAVEVSVYTPLVFRGSSNRLPLIRIPNLLQSQPCTLGYPERFESAVQFIKMNAGEVPTIIPQDS